MALLPVIEHPHTSAVHTILDWQTFSEVWTIIADLILTNIQWSLIIADIILTNIQWSLNYHRNLDCEHSPAHRPFNKTLQLTMTCTIKVAVEVNYISFCFTVRSCRLPGSTYLWARVFTDREEYSTVGPWVYGQSRVQHRKPMGLRTKQSTAP